MKRFLLLGVLLTIGVARAQAPTPVPPPGMVYVPAGDFVMGTDGADREGPNIPLNSNDARPRHTATTAAFFLDKTEVTNEQYKKFCDATQYPVPVYWKNGTYAPADAQVPVTHVSWYEATAYAKWVGKRLPTETEWEKAARGTDGRDFPWGDGWDSSRAVWGVDGPQTVGQKLAGASPYGVLDMAGNVFEWTSSWFDAYPNAPVKIPSFGKNYKVIRGGGYMGYESICRTWYRCVFKPTGRSEWIGFRCAKDAP
jgi:formylglycine-generating enzyme required for sulfatase activity